MILEKGQVQFVKKISKNNLRIITKPHAYLQTMNNTPLKFRENRFKSVGGVAPTMYPLSIHIVIDNARKMAKFNLRKNDKNNQTTL